jgi:hypothetical protein
MWLTTCHKMLHPFATPGLALHEQIQLIVDPCFFLNRPDQLAFYGSCPQSALFHRDEFPRVIAGIDLARARDLLLGIL